MVRVLGPAGVVMVAGMAAGMVVVMAVTGVEVAGVGVPGVLGVARASGLWSENQTCSYHACSSTV